MATDVTTIVLPGSNGEHRICLPAGRLGEVLSPGRHTGSRALPDLVRHALDEPAGCAPLAEMVQPGARVLVVVDDVTRTTPVSEVVPELLHRLHTAGCRDGDIAFAVALGTHRPMTRSEIEAKIGVDAARRFPVINTPAQDRQAFVSIGESWEGEPIEVHREVLAADLVIGIGSVVPHSDAGWSGGCKIILPGMCSEGTVTANHLLSARYPGNALGQERVPLREAMEAAVARIGLDFVLNLVMTPYGDVVGVYGGHFVAAQRAAVRAAQGIYGIPFRERAEVVVSNAYPYEMDLWQASKGVCAGELLLKPGGTLILNAPCPEGVGPHPDYAWLMRQTPDRILWATESGEVTDRIAAGVALPVAHMMGHMQLVIVSTGLAPELFAGGPIRLETSLQAALDAALDGAGPGTRVSLLTHAGYSFPISG